MNRSYRCDGCGASYSPKVSTCGYCGTERRPILDDVPASERGTIRADLWHVGRDIRLYLSDGRTSSLYLPIQGPDIEGFRDLLTGERDSAISLYREVSAVLDAGEVEELISMCDEALSREPGPRIRW